MFMYAGGELADTTMHAFDGGGVPSIHAGNCLHLLMVESNHYHYPYLYYSAYWLFTEQEVSYSKTTL